MDWEARRDGLMLTETSEELLVYDQQSHAIHHLNPLAAFHWRQVEPHVTDASLLTAARSQLDPNTDATAIQFTLDQLAGAGLITGQGQVASAVSRRRLLRTTAIGGIAIPAVISVTAPMAAQASSNPCGAPSEPGVVLSLRPSGNPIYTHFTISISGFAPNTTYHWDLGSVWEYIQGGSITTDACGFGSVDPTPSHICNGQIPPENPQFHATVEGIMGWAYFPCPPQ